VATGDGGAAAGWSGRRRWYKGGFGEMRAREKGAGGGAPSREQQQIGVVRARRLEGSGNFGPRVAGRGRSSTEAWEKQRGKMEDRV